MKPIVLALCTLVLLLGPGRSSEAQFANVGSLNFPTSGSPEAQRHFLRGVAILHSFGWKQAIEQFREAQRLDPDFAMAYWGETLCYNHPLFARAPDNDSPRAALARLGDTREARLAKAPTDREKGFLEAVEALWGEGDYDDRRVRYMEAMARLHDRFPDDDEVATFYALSLLSGSRALGDQTLRLEIQAGALALDVFGRNPDHPGAPHYAIHAFDDPIHAPLALPAALRYAEIAPAVAHARHMPTHIFIQHGMWDLVASHNQTAYEAARDLWKPGDSVGDTVHALDWGQYGDLQRGDYHKARIWIERLEMVDRESDGAARARDTLPLVRARYVVETEEWRTFPIPEDGDPSPHELLATTLSAVSTDQNAVAERAASRLAHLAAQADARPAVKIMSAEAAALVALANGRGDTAVEHMDMAVEIAEGQRPPNGAASPVKPPYELYGEILLELGRHDDALDKFDTSLRRMPKRARSLLGAARAAAALGDRQAAEIHYQTLMAIWRDHTDVPGYDEAQRFVGETQ